ncbi:MAG: hypothetical protein VX498_01815 [Myxococcota bacterium]|nr:hypothetical protein [Myxococcota bacterium]
MLRRSTKRWFLLLPLLALLGCPTDPGDDDDQTIEAPAGCALPALSNVSFSFLIHYEGEDYAQADLLTLMEDFGATNFSFAFAPAVVTELGEDPDSNRLAITLTDNTPPPEGEPPPEDPNYVRIVYELPLGYSLPVHLGQEMGSITGLDTSTGNLIAAFGLWEMLEDEAGEPYFELLFLAEPSDLGNFWTPGPFHPVFAEVGLRDRACPNLNALQCASTYNLSMEFTTLDELDEDGNVIAAGEDFELWPTEHADFSFMGLELRVVNVWSFTHREINPDCTGG